MSRSLVVSFLLACIFLASPATAQNWIPIGPPGGSVRALACDPRDPDRLYLGTADGTLFRSDDAGHHWHPLVPGFPLRGASLDQVAVDARGTVLVGYWEVAGKGGGVARSIDGGHTFSLCPGVTGESVRALAVAPTDPRMIAAGTSNGVFLSQDDGSAWRRITPHGDVDLRGVESLAFDPVNAQVLYAGTRHLAWKTLDGGAAWRPVHDGMIDDSDVMTMTVDRAAAQTLYATACSGIYRSTAGGAAWSKLVGIPFASRRTRAFAQGAGDPGLLLAGTTAGLWLSEDGGASWRLSTARDLVVNALLVQGDGTILLGAEGAGVLRSSDRGRTWTASNEGFSDRFVSRLLFDTAGQRLIVSVWGDDGVFVTKGVRGPWVHLGEGLKGRQVLSLACRGGTLLAGTDDGIYARAASATTWTRMTTLLAGRESHPRVTELRCVAPTGCIAATTRGVMMSTDAGRTWTQPGLLADDPVFGLAGSTADPNAMLVATAGGFFRSADGGVAWVRVSPALPGVTPHALAIMDADERVVLATTTGGLYRSDDAGATWRCVGGGLPRSDLSGLAIHLDGRTIDVSDFTWGGIFRSVDGGANWRRMPRGDLPSEHVWALGLDPAEPECVLASSAGGLYLRLPAIVAADAEVGP